MLIAQLTDLHITAGPDGDAAARGAALAVEVVHALRPAATAVVVTGDVTDDGAPQSYQRASDILSVLSAPIHTIPGNHDDGEALRAAFGAPDGGRYRQGVVELDGLALVLCDSTLPGTDAGALDDGRLEWIAARLDELSDRPSVIAVHHPPIVTGITAMDALGLAGIPEFAAVVSDHPEVRGVIAGHLHRAIAGRVGHAPVVVCPSTHVQVRLDFEFDDAVSMVQEPPAIAIHRLSERGDLVSHFQPTGSYPAV
jgi:3',5'-cyclic AMP phosphodiesterase CpdA